VRTQKYFYKNLKKKIAHKKLKKPPQKVAYLWQLGLFYSAALPAQNCPELHSRFINSFIQPSLQESLPNTQIREQMSGPKIS
jgi:hypothetical protein